MIFREMFDLRRQWKEGSSMVAFDDMRPSDRTLLKLMSDYQASSPAEAEVFDLDHWRRFARAFTVITLFPFSDVWHRVPDAARAEIKTMIDDDFRKMMRELDAKKRWAVLTSARLDNPNFMNELRRLGAL